MQEESDNCVVGNLRLVKELCESKVCMAIIIDEVLRKFTPQANELMNQFRHNTGITKLKLPLKDDELDSRYVLGLVFIYELSMYVSVFV